MLKDRANDPNRKLKLSRPNTAYNFMHYVGPENYTKDERVKSAEFTRDLNDWLFPNSPFKGKFNA